MDYKVCDERELITAINSEDVTSILFDNDITLSEKITVTHPKTIDLNGCVFTVKAFEGFTVSKCKVSVVNGELKGIQEDPIVADGTGTTVVLGSGLTVNSEDCAIHIKGKAKVVVDGADVTSHGEHAAVFVEGFGTAKENSTLDMRKGSIVATKQTAVSVTKGGTFLFKNGHVESQTSKPNEDDTATIYLEGMRTSMLMTDGEAYSEYTAALTVSNGATATINGGCISSKACRECTAELLGSKSTIILNGGRIACSESNGILLDKSEDDSSSELEITNGCVVVPDHKKCIVSKYADPSIVITGGRFHGKLDTSYVADGYKTVVDSDGYINVIPIPVDVSTSDDDNEDITQDSSPADESDDTSSTKEPLLQEGKSVIVTATSVYGNPSRRFVICSLVGCATVIRAGYTDNIGNTYVRVQFKLPGSGKICTGYILTSAIKQESEQ